MKIFVLKGSPNQGGNTNILLERFLDGVKSRHEELEIKNFDAYRELAVKPCTDCGACNRTGNCIDPDFEDRILKNVLRADVIVFAAPIYFMSFPAPLKAAVDRFQIFFAQKFLDTVKDNMNQKKGILITTFGGPGTNYDMYLKDLASVLFPITMKIKDYELLYARNTDRIKVKENKDLLENAFQIGLKI